MTGALLRIGDRDGIHYEYDPPGAGRPTFCFVNALTGSTGVWQAAIGPRLRAEGCGTLAWNFRGQADSPFTPGLALTPALVIEDLQRLLQAIRPPRPILVGLSIGGLFAAWAHLRGAPAAGLVLINTLRIPRARIEWINQAMVRAAGLGGLRLVMDLYMPLLVGEERAQAVRASFLTDEPYAPLRPGDGHMELLAHAAGADWDLPYERIHVPTLIITGLADRLFLDRDDVARLAARLPDARRLDMETAGHLVPVERGAETAEALLRFAESL